MIVLALPEPAVIHNKSLDTDAGCLLRKLLLSFLIHIELGRLPGVVEYRSKSRVGCLRQNIGQLIAVHRPRGFAKSGRGESPVEDRGLQSLARAKLIAKIKGIETAGNAHLLHRVLSDGNAPRPAPRQSAEPYAAFGLACYATCNRK